ncbi:MAG: SdrD B-like domain-containing protein, partial [Saccharofermentanales bacterium]
MMLTKRFLCYLIVFSMLISLFSAFALAEPIPAYAFIPNMGDASVSKVDLSATPPLVVARYYTAPRLDATGAWGDLFGSNTGDLTAIAPAAWRTSRIAIDPNGNAWAINTGADALSAITTVQGSVARIQLNTTGLTTTSTSAADIEVFGTDEAVKVIPVGDRGDCPRSINIDTAGNIWIGFHKAQEKYGYFQKYAYDGTNLTAVGSRVYGSTAFTEGSSDPVPAFDIAPYNADIDANGILWFVSYGSSRVNRNGGTYGATNGVYSFDTNNPIATFVRHNESNVSGASMGYMKSGYGIVVDDSDTANVKVFVTIMDTTGGSVVGLYYKEGSADFVRVPITLSAPRGMVFDNDGVLWIANSTGGSVTRYDPKGIVPTATYTGFGTTPVGIGKDPMGRLWVVVRDSDRLVGFDPATPNVRIIIASGFNDPYAYGDFTRPPQLYRICGYKLDDDTRLGLEGWEINIYKWDDVAQGFDEEPFKAPVFTGPDGKYCFTELPEGTYLVKEENRVGWKQTFPGGDGTHIISLPADSLNHITNGDFEAGNIGFGSDYTYVSVAAQDPGLGTMEPEQVYAVGTDPWLYHELWSHIVDHTTGDENNLMMIVNGADQVADQRVWYSSSEVLAGTDYTFSFWGATSYPEAFATLDVYINDVKVGEYKAPSAVAEWSQFTVEWNSGLATTADIKLVCNTLIHTGTDFALDDISLRSHSADFRNAQLYGICGYKRDADTDAVLSGWTIKLRDNSGAIIATTVTGSDGKYCFTDLRAGTYRVEEVQKDGWLQTAPIDGHHDIILPDAASDSTTGPFYDFENAKLYELFGFKYNDDTGAPIAGWKIILEMKVDGIWAPVGEATTGADGRYLFTQLRA